MLGIEFSGGGLSLLYEILDCCQQACRRDSELGIMDASLLLLQRRRSKEVTNIFNSELDSKHGLC